MTSERRDTTEKRKFRHDLNNRLAALIGELDLLRDDLDEGSPVRDRLAGILGTAGGLADALGRDRADMRPRRRVREALHAIDDLLARHLGSTRFEHAAVGPETQPGIPAAPGQLELLLLSLIGAGRFLHGPERPLVLLSGYAPTAGEDGDRRRFAIRIQHDGADRRSIAQGAYDRRLKSATEAARLAPCCPAALAVAEDLGGTLHHDVATGQDSRITAYLPLAAPSRMRPAVGPAHCPAGRRRTVLVVDDDGLVRGFLRQSLERAGFGVIDAANADEAIGVTGHLDRPIDLLIIDLVLPGMHGGRLGPQLARALQDPPMLYMSGYDDEAIRHHRLLAPGIPYLRKPFDRSELLRRVLSLVTRDDEERGSRASQEPPRAL